MHGQSVYPFSDQFGANTIPFGAAHTFITYIKDYTPDGVGIIWSQMQASQHLDNCRKSPTRQQTNAPKFIKRKTCCIYPLSSLKWQSDPSRWHFCNSFQSSLRLNAFEISNTLTSSKTAHSLSPLQRPLCTIGRLEKRKKKARGGQWEGEKKKRGFPSSHRPPRVFYFSKVAIFIGILSGNLCGEERFILSCKSFRFGF